MRDSHREQVPDRSISWRGMGLGSRGPLLASRCGVSRRCGLRLAAAISGPEGFESGLAVRPWCAAPGGAGRLRIGGLDRVGIGRSFHAAGGACTRGQPCAMRSGRSWHSGDPDSESHGRSTWNLANPGARVSRTLRRPWEHEALNAERPSITGTAPSIRSSILPWVTPRRSSIGARLEHQGLFVTNCAEYATVSAVKGRIGSFFVR